MGTYTDLLGAREQPATPACCESGVRLRSVLIACIAVSPILSNAAPVVVEEAARIAAPDPTYRFPGRVAVEGDTIIATGIRFEGDIEHQAAFLFQRQSNGAWVYVRTLAQTSCNSGEGAEDTCIASVAIRNGVAVVAAGQVHVFERASDGSWIEAPGDGFTGPGDAAVGTGAVVTSETAGCRWDSNVLAKNSAGVWTLATTIPGPGHQGCDDWGVLGKDVDMSAGNRWIVGYDDLREVHIYEPDVGAWTRTATLPSPVNGPFGEAVAMDDGRAFASGVLATPIHVFSRSAGGWTHSANITPPDAAQYAPPSTIKVRDLVAAGFLFDPDRGGSVRLFQQTSSGQFEEAARLVASNSGTDRLFVGGEIDAYVNGAFARIVASVERVVETPVGSTLERSLYVFDLDEWGATPAPQQENFEQGAANWTPSAGSFSVTTSSGTRVYRQSSTAGDAGSFVASLDRTNQAIEADVRPTAFNGANRWVGLAVRRTDANNNYYVALRQSNVLELKRMVNGAFMTLASMPIPVVLNRTYRLRLEAIGTLLRVYVDGRLALQAHDAALTHGHAGVRMYRARADIDNVVLSHNPHLALLDQRRFIAMDQRWNVGPGAWSEDHANFRLAQQDVSGAGRAVSKVDAEDHIVQVRAAATSFAAGAGSRWFGVMARYRDENNYHYVTVRKDNTISLRKLVNGATHVLDSAPLTVSPGTTYTLRLEAIGAALRAYVNGRLLLEATDAAPASGRYGLATYRTATTFDDFIAWEP